MRVGCLNVSMNLDVINEGSEWIIDIMGVTNTYERCIGDD